MLRQNTVREPYDVDCDEGARLTVSAEAALEKDEVSLGRRQAAFVAMPGRQSLDQIEEPLATRRDVSTVLDVVGRPVSLGSFVVALVEQGVESLDHERFLLCRRIQFPWHVMFLLLTPAASARLYPPASCAGAFPLP